MTIKETIETLEIAKAEVEWEYPLDYAIAIDTAIDVLKKEIPTKYIPGSIEERTYFLPHCPNCKMRLTVQGQDRCRECNQRIDWEVI